MTSFGAPTGAAESLAEHPAIPRSANAAVGHAEKMGCFDRRRSRLPMGESLMLAIDQIISLSSMGPPIAPGTTFRQHGRANCVKSRVVTEVQARPRSARDRHSGPGRERSSA